MPINVSPIRAEISIADRVAATAEPLPELLARGITLGADEHFLIVLAGMFWLYARSQQPPLQNAANHLLAVTLASSILPHALKVDFNQKRPDRVYLRAHRRGVPVSGNAGDAFPSGHAVHMGALASAATELPKTYRNVVWTTAGILSLSRIVVLAHWMTDVVAGLAIGAALERLLRQVTGFPKSLDSDHKRRREYVLTFRRLYTHIVYCR